MIRNSVQAGRVALVLALTSLLAACGGSNTMMESPVSVGLSPSSVALGTGEIQTTQFEANVSGSGNTAVSWSVNGVAGGNSTAGTISPAGLYTSPVASTSSAETVTAAPTSQVVIVTATSVADPSKSASATVILVPPGQVSSTANPQVAQYSFTSPTDATVTVQFGPDTSYGFETWQQAVPAGGGTLNMLVAGMRANTSYHMRASVQFSNGIQYEDSDHTFTTGGLPANRLPNITITVPKGPNTGPGIELLSLGASPTNQILAAAVDLEGNVIWYYDFSNIPGVTGEGPFPIKNLPNGHMKIQIGSYLPNAPVSTVQEIDLAGNVIYQLTNADLNARLAKAGLTLTSVGFHHDFATLPNGHTIYLVLEQRSVILSGDTSPTLVTGDSLVDIDPNGNPTWTWSTFDHLDVNYHPLGLPDWTHSNALIYSASDRNLILSSRSLSWVIKIDYNNGAGTGDILWKLGPNGDFTLQNGGPSDWFYNQHFPVILNPTAATGEPLELAVWDNGNSRPDPTTGTPCGQPGAGPCYSRGLILNVNEAAKTASIVWQDNLSPLFALCCGDIGVLSNGDVDMGTGALSVFPGSTEALEVTQESSPQVVWQMNVTGQLSYRMVRIPSLYPGVTW